MQFNYLLGASQAPVRKRYQIDATVAREGIPFLVAAGNKGGLAQAGTTGADGMVGVNLDTATFVTAQQTDGTSAERTVSIIINPDAVYKCKISGGAASGTTLTVRDATSTSSTGLTVTTGDDYTTPEMDEGVLWGFDGANADQVRGIISTTSTSATVEVAFDNDIAIGDNFIHAPLFPTKANTVTLTTELDEMRQDSAVSTSTAALRCVELRLRDTAQDGDTNSFALLISGNHIFGGVLS